MCYKRGWDVTRTIEMTSIFLYFGCEWVGNLLLSCLPVERTANMLVIDTFLFSGLHSASIATEAKELPVATNMCTSMYVQTDQN